MTTTTPPESAASVHVAAKFPPELRDRIDAYAAQLAAEVPGIEVTRSAALRRLVELGLRVAEGHRR